MNSIAKREQSSCQRLSTARKLIDWLFGYDCFISHRQRTAGTYAENLRERLLDGKPRLMAFRDASEDGFVAGERLAKETERAIRSSTGLVVVVNQSAFAADSIYMPVEILRFEKMGKLIIPIDVDGCLRAARLDPTVRKSLAESDDAKRILEILLDRITIEEFPVPAIVPSDVVINKLRGSLRAVTRAQRRTTILATIAILFMALAVSASILAVVAKLAQQEAEHLARTNRARRAAMLSQTLAERGESTKALLLAAESERSSSRAGEPPIKEAVSSLRAAIGSAGGIEWHLPEVKDYSFSPILNSLVISPDGQYILTADLEGKVRRWAMREGQPTSKGIVLAQFEDVATVLRNNTVSMDEHASRTTRSVELLTVNSKWAIVESDRRLSAICYTEAGQMPSELLDRSSFRGPWATTVRLSPDGRWLYVSGLGSGSADVRPPGVIDLSGLPQNPKWHELPTESWNLGFTSDSKWLVTTNENGTLQFHCLNGPKITQPISTKKFAKASIAGKTIVTINDRHVMQFWCIDGGRLSKSREDILIQLTNIHSISASARGEFIAVVGDGVCVVDLRQSMPQLRHIDVDASGFFEFSPNSDWFIGGPRNTFDLFLLDLRSLHDKTEPRVLRLLNGQNAARRDLGFSLDGRWLIAGDRNQSGRLCDLSLADPIASTYVLSGTQFHDVSFSPKSDWFFLRNSDTVRFWLLRENDLMNFASTLAGRNLNQSEWHAYFPEEPYHTTFETFGKLPGH